MQLLLVSLGCEVPDEATAAEKHDIRLTMCLEAMKAVCPSWTELEATKACSKGFDIEHPECEGSAKFDKDLILEVVTTSEAKEVVDFDKSLGKVRSKKEKFLVSRTQRVECYFPKAPALNKRRKKMTAAPRWLPAPQEATGPVTKHIAAFLPTPASVLQDDYNGRWYINYLGKNSVSFSWTKRGYGAAAALALHKGWAWHTEVCGEAPQWSLDELARDFAS